MTTKAVAAALLFLSATILPASASEGWGDWKAISAADVFYAVKCRESDSWSPPRYEWSLKFRNQEDRKVSLTYHYKSSKGPDSSSGGRTTISAHGETEAGATWFSKSDTCGEGIVVQISSVNIGGS